MMRFNMFSTSCRTGACITRAVTINRLSIKTLFHEIAHVARAAAALTTAHGHAALAPRACTAPAGSENMKLSIQRAGLKHLRVITGCGEERAVLKRVLETAAVVVCSSLVEATVRSMAPKGKEIIVDHKRLDRAGIEMLRSRLTGISARPHAGGNSNARARRRAPRKEA